MVNVVVVAPFLGASMGHVLRCFASLENTRLGVISHDPLEQIPAEVRARLEGHMKVDDALDPQQLVDATRRFVKEWGRVDRLEGYLEQLQVPLGTTRDALDLDGMREAAARNFRDKNRMKSVLADHGVPVARQARITSASDARAFVAAVGYPIILKPLDGAGARDTFRVVDEGTLYRALDRLVPTPGRAVQAEQFISGEEHSFETVVLDGKPVWSSSMRYFPGPLAVMENPWMQWCMLLPREQSAPHIEAFRPHNHRALAALGLRNGISHMEWFLQPGAGGGRPIVSEVGARPPGANIMKLIGLAHDVDMWAVYARLMVHRTFDIPERRFATGCAFLRGQGEGPIIRRLAGWDAVRERLGATIVATNLPQLGQPHSLHYEGDGWVIVRHPRSEGVMDALGALVKDMRVELGP